MEHSSAKHILVVDDSPDIQELLTLFLEAKGYSIDCSSNGEEAFTLLNPDLKLPDLILVTIRLNKLE